MLQIVIYTVLGVVAGILAGLIISTYRYPVWEVRKMIAHARKQGTGLGEWIHVQRFADHNDKVIVKPSHDILYSYTFIDLRSGPYLLKMPWFDHYFSFAFLDINTDVLGYYTNRDVSEGESVEVVISRGRHQTENPNIPVISLNAKICWLIGRFGVSDPSDPDATNRIQQQITLSRLSE